MRPDIHERFAALHRARQPLLLPNAWDAASAGLLQAAGADAVGTSSAAVAWSRGYADGGGLPREELMSAVRGIARVLAVPLTVDLEDGYSNHPGTVGELVAAVVRAGAVGVNIEDGAGEPELLAEKIRAIRSMLADVPVFINARTDVYLRALARGPAAVTETIGRLRRYHDAGADGGFVPGLASVEEAAAVAAAVPLPLNIMAVPGMPAIPALQAAGVRRISVGPALFEAAYAHCDEAGRAFLAGDATALFGVTTLEYGAMNELFAGRGLG